MNTDLNNASLIKRLAGVTREIIIDCALENGGIVAANSTKQYFPANAKNYFYIWPRDAAYTCLVANIMGLKEISKNFFRWCLIHAEGFKTNGLLYEKYYPNGLKSLFNFQPDQTGAVLFAVYDYCQYNPSEVNDPEIRELITLAAEGICNSWKGNHFTKITNDVWEERFCFPELEENFTYSLASCIKGLRCSDAIIPTRKWLRTSEEMKNRLDEHFDRFFPRSYGKLPDYRIDASIIGLVYPFEIYSPDHPMIIRSIAEIENQLVINGGVHRYANDDYDGWMHEGKHINKGAGAWPLLNFWLSIYYSLRNDRKKAEEYYYWVISRQKDNLYIPEQIFENNLQVSVSPLLWSHTMFFLAARHLDLI